MTNGSDRLDRIERILEDMATTIAEGHALIKETAERQKETAERQKETAEGQAVVSKALQEMAARQQYHDEALERHDAGIKELREAIQEDGKNRRIDRENILALARIAEIHERRLEDLEGGGVG